MIDASVSPPALSPLAGAGAGSGGSGHLLEDRAKPSLPRQPVGKLGLTWITRNSYSSSDMYSLNTSTNENRA